MDPIKIVAILKCIVELFATTRNVLQLVVKQYDPDDERETAVLAVVVVPTV